MIYDDIKNYHKQFAYEPKIENTAKLKKKFVKFLVVGMGGSHLAADLLKVWKPDLDVVVWKNYGLPTIKDIKDRFIIVSSYSGTTEEVIDAFNAARARRLPLAVIAARGRLIALAEKWKVPYVQMPDFHMQPRMATGLSMKAILALMGDKQGLLDASMLATHLRPSREEHRGKDLAKRLHGSVPVFYASVQNAALAENWKIKLNEGSKIPAFWNVVPELNHNEMTGFDVKPRTTAISKHFHFVFLKDIGDDRRIARRMNVLEKLLHDRGFKVEVVMMQGKTPLQKIFDALILADWTAYYSGKLYEVDPEQVPMVEEFKRLIGKG